MAPPPVEKRPTMREFFSRLRESFVLTPRTLGLVWRASPKTTIALGAMTIVGALLPLTVAYAGKGIVDAVVAQSRAATLHWVLIELACVLAQAVSQRGLGLVRQLLGARLGLEINTRIIEKALTLELRHFEDSEFYDRLTRARMQASYRPISVVTETFQLIQNTLTLLGYGALLIKFSIWAAAGLLLASVPAAAVELHFSRSAFRLSNWRSPDTRRLNYLEYVLATDHHVKEVKLFGLGRELVARYKALGQSFYEQDRNLAVRRAAWAFLLSLVGTGAFYLCYAVMAIAGALGRITLGTMTLYIVAFRQGQQAFQSVLAAIGGMYEDNLYMSNLFQYFDIATAQSEITPSPEAPAAPKQLPSTNGHNGVVVEDGIRFVDVGFKYPGPGDRWALRHIDLFIPRGQSIALVGQNGAGKTTLIKLLTRLYSPTEGHILLDGKDLASWSEDALRSRIGVIFQDFNEYQLSVRENVAFGSVRHLDDEPRVLRASSQGGADEVIATLPSGLDTQLGGWFRDGQKLSGGQWQKVALARAFMREEADILVLDEPTAALDAEAEHAVFERFRTLARGRTAIVISHRFPTVRMADRILVLADGQVVEDGTHAALVAAGARYAQLFALQARGYQ